MTVKPKVDDPFLALLEKAVKDVLNNDKSTSAEKLKAIDSGAKLLQIKHKIGEGGDGSNYFSGQ